MFHALAILYLAPAVVASQSFVEAFPDSHREVGKHEYLVRASNFHATSSASSVEQAGRDFLLRFGEDFGVHKFHGLVCDQPLPRAGQMGTLRFHLTIDGLPVLQSSVVLDIAGDGAVTYVTVSDITDKRSHGRFVLDEQQAIVAARKALKGDNFSQATPTAIRGYLDDGSESDQLRPVWQIDVGEWRVILYADDGRVAYVKYWGEVN
jgi:hypothetical protein